MALIRDQKYVDDLAVLGSEMIRLSSQYEQVLISKDQLAADVVNAVHRHMNRDRVAGDEK
jgi:hypothetical protein